MGTIIIEGVVVTPRGEDRQQIRINQITGLIERLGRHIGTPDLCLEKELIFPGFGDIHIHAREDPSGMQAYKEDFRTASAAAINGGVVFAADMPNNPAAPADKERYLAKQSLSRKSSIPLVLYAAIGPDTQPLPFPVPYKVFMGPSVGNTFFASVEQVEETLRHYAGQRVSFHCEDPSILKAHADARSHETQRPPEAEISAITHALRLIDAYDLQGKICHCSTKQGIEMIVQKKRDGLPVTCEVAPHHLYFDQSMLTEKNRPLLQVNPPIRTADDRLALIDRLRTGDIDYLATDHAPHTVEEKQRGISGMPHLDTYGPFVTWLITEHAFTPQDILRVCCENPADFVHPFLPAGHGKGCGRIEEGYAGSLTILNLQTPFRVTADTLKTKCGWSPFEGVTFPGRVAYTVVSGRVVKHRQ